MAKMTREQARKLLIDRKVMVKNMSKEIQEKLFEIGFYWEKKGTRIMNENHSYLFIREGKIFSSSDTCIFSDSNLEEITAEEILSIEIIEDYVPKFGDIVRVNTNCKNYSRDYMICIMPDYEIPDTKYDNIFFDIACIDLEGKLIIDRFAGYDRDDEIIPASESEKQELFDKLAKAGKRWNADKKCLEDIQQELDLCEILKDCPKGTEFYSSLFGKVKFIGVNKKDRYFPIKVMAQNKEEYGFTKKGYYFPDYNCAECVIFPSKDQRDWSKWVCPKPDLPIDTPVMVNDGDKINWILRCYAGGKHTYKYGLKKKDSSIRIPWKHIIPFDKFNPNDIEESLKYDICR